MAIFIIFFGIFLACLNFYWKPKMETLRKILIISLEIWNYFPIFAIFTFFIKNGFKLFFWRKNGKNKKRNRKIIKTFSRRSKNRNFRNIEEIKAKKITELRKIEKIENSRSGSSSEESEGNF